MRFHGSWYAAADDQMKAVTPQSVTPPPQFNNFFSGKAIPQSRFAVSFSARRTRRCHNLHPRARVVKLFVTRSSSVVYVEPQNPKTKPKVETAGANSRYSRSLSTRRLSSHCCESVPSSLSDAARPSHSGIFNFSVFASLSPKIQSEEHPNPRTALLLEKSQTSAYFSTNLLRSAIASIERTSLNLRVSSEARPNQKIKPKVQHQGPAKYPVPSHSVGACCVHDVLSTVCACVLVVCIVVVVNCRMACVT